MSAKYTGLNVFCNGCGEPMRDLGEWPFVWPKSNKPGHNMQQSSRYVCRTCKYPNSPNVPVGIVILETDLSDRDD